MQMPKKLTQPEDSILLRHLLTLSSFDRADIEGILDRAERYRAAPGATPPRDTTLRGRTVANLFFEASTRTRASFELAAKRLSADVLNLDVNMSSRAKGESVLDTIYTLEAMHVDIFVVRDAGTGVPAMITRHVEPHVCVLNAGESEVSHPTQGLLDLLTIVRHKGSDLSNTKVAIVGDIAHSRVASSAYEALTRFEVGQLVFVAPDELLPANDRFPLADRASSLESGLRDADVVMGLRLQRERFSQLGDIPDPQEYFRCETETAEVLLRVRYIA